MQIVVGVAIAAVLQKNGESSKIKPKPWRRRAVPIGGNWILQSITSAFPREKNVTRLQNQKVIIQIL